MLQLARYVLLLLILVYICFRFFFFFQAEDGIRDLVRSRGLGDVYKRQDEEPEDDGDHAADDRDPPAGGDALQSGTARPIGAEG